MTELRENSNNPEDSHIGWDELANGPADNGESQETKAELSRSELLKRAIDDLVDFFDRNKDVLSDDVRKSLSAAYRELGNQMEEAETDECAELLPESRREAFRDYVARSMYTGDDIKEAVRMRAAGKSDVEIHDYIISIDHHGADEEDNRQRGESTYNNIISIIGEQEQK